jgi:hypothetical protein
MTPTQKKLLRLRGIWRDQIFADPKVNHAAFRVGYGLSTFMTMQKTAEHYSASGVIVVFPSHATLVKDANVSPDTVRTSIARLEKLGHLQKTRRGNSWTGSNHYKLLFKTGRRNASRKSSGTDAEFPG